MKTIKKEVKVYIEYPQCELCGEAVEPIGMRTVEVADQSWMGMMLNRTREEYRDVCKCTACGNEQETRMWDYPIHYEIVKE